MRMFVARVHPDKFTAFPKEAEANEESLSELTGFLATAENDYLEIEPRSIDLRFYVEEDGDSEQLREVKFNLSTKGYAPDPAKRQLVRLFKEVGVATPEFAWDSKYWFVPYGVQHKTAKEKAWEVERRAKETEEQNEDEGDVTKRKAAAPTDINATLQAIAAVPFLEKGHRVIAYVNEVAFKELRAAGYVGMKQRAKRMWGGERNLSRLAANMDDEHRKILETLLKHTTDLEKEKRLDDE